MCNSIEDLSVAVANACVYLQNENIPYNVLITDRGTRVSILPQCYAERQARGEVDQEILDTQVNPAVWEISGHIVLKQRKDYDSITEEYAWKLLAEVSLPFERFEQVKAECLKAAFEGVVTVSPTSTVASNANGGSFNLLESKVTVQAANEADSMDAVVPNFEG